MSSYDLSARLHRLERMTQRPKLYEARVAVAADGMDGALKVVIPGFDGGRQRWPVDFWMPRGNSTPQRGDAAVVSLTDTNRVVVVAWTPGVGVDGGAGPSGRRKDQTVNPNAIDRGSPRDIINNVVLPIAAKHGINRTIEENDAANESHSDTSVSGNTSDHAGPPETRWAADMSNGTMTPEEDALAEELAAVFEIPWSGPPGGPTRTANGFKYQLIYGTPAGSVYGDHTDHVHFGLHRV